MKHRAKLYFSFRSPYSWLTLRRLRAAVPNLDADLDCFPYWDPDEHTEAALAERGGEFHYIQMSRAKHLYMLQDTKRLAERAGLTMAWPIDIDSRWELPHLGWLVARHFGRQWEFYDAIVAARWGRGEDICLPEVIAAAAETAGLDPAPVLAGPTDPDTRAEGVECLYQAYLDDVFGIPYVKWGRQRFWGLDRLDLFIDAWRPGTVVRAEPDPLVSMTVEQRYDSDTAGGCG